MYFLITVPRVIMFSHSITSMDKNQCRNTPRHADFPSLLLLTESSKESLHRLLILLCHKSFHSPQLLRLRLNLLSQSSHSITSMDKHQCRNTPRHADFPSLLLFTESSKESLHRLLIMNTKKTERLFG